jgi:N-acetylgalactosamine kinase
MNVQNNVNCIILCGGKGTRMQSKEKHKVCFDINGKPAIYHGMDNYLKAGINRFVVVVGAMAGQVVECIGSRYDGVSFAYQKEALGTGNAARTGWNNLKSMGVEGPILITMGDKIIDSSVIESLMEQFYKTNADLVFTVQPREHNVTGGHIVIDKENKVRGICESLDIQKSLIYKKFLTKNGDSFQDVATVRDFALSTAEEIISSEKKRQRVVEEIRGVFEKITADPESAMKVLEGNSNIKLGEDKFEPEDAANAQYVNTAVYLFKPSAFEYALQFMNRNNAANEEYLTEMINVLCNTKENGEYKYNVSIIPIEEKERLLTYNNVEELLKVEEILKGREKLEEKLSFDVLKPVQEWIELFEVMPENLYGELIDIYGDNTELIEDRRKAYIDVLNHFVDKFGRGRNVIITRAPGRVNLMGRHIEHRGGNINVISINKEVIAIASPSEDENRVRITNISTDFQDREFDISSHFAKVNWDNWLNFLESDSIKKMVMESRGDWINYVKAPVLRLQYLYKTQKLRGMDIAFTGNIPIAAGLSSSSAIVVASAEAAVALNDLDVTPQNFVDLCGEGEWFVGSRGGAGDHAAMKYGERGYVTTLGFFPFGYRGSFQFPQGYRMLIANSYVKANKTTNAKDIFNQRVASYEFAVMMIKDSHPELADKIKYLRDINPETLGVLPSVIYKLLLELPEKMTQKELFEIISDKYHDDIKRIISSHVEPEYYLIRSVALYGIAECMRAKVCKELLENGEFEKFGTLMKISHDGDRVVYFDEKGNCHDYDYRYPDDKLKGLIRDLESQNPKLVDRAQLEMQPGGYACSTAEVDYIVDVTISIDGVIGAQLSGAGLGGCVMILVKEDAVENVIETLEREYYQPRGLENGITVCVPVKGSGVLSINGD